MDATISTAGATYHLRKTGGVSGDWDAQAYSNETFTGTTVLAFTVSAVDGGADAYCVGLSADNPDANYTGIDFGLLNDAGTMYASENGVLTSLGATVAGDDWQITRASGGAVTVQKNGSTVRTMTGTSTAALRVDSSFRFSNDPVEAVGVTNNGTLQVLTWTASGVTVTEE